MVHFLDIDRKHGETLAASTPLATFHACDLRDIAALRVAVKDIELLDGAIGVPIKNAGSDARHPIEAVEPGYRHERLAFDLDHQLSASQAVADRMKERGSRAITMTSSTSWIKSRPGMVAHTTSRGAVVGLTRTLAG
jgi:NAD(P)-dependent dehydrogenase (short-subunit alcohol dehydrogenase family)